jgi:hypothetical protein
MADLYERQGRKATGLRHEIRVMAAGLPKRHRRTDSDDVGARGNFTDEEA